MDPQQVGQYRIIKELGVGGMGRVLLARDTRLPREVALKLLDRDPLHGAALRERFEREARTIASLEHHAIVPVYDFGEHDGHLYLVMRLMRGGSLQQRLHGAPLPMAQALPIVERIAAALDKAHANGVIHRDLKPANILFDDEQKAYLSDFGIVKLFESEQRLTQTGGILGTPAYMSPEQGRGDPVDGRSDIYALGVVLYQMATGRVPFQADTPIATVLKHVRDPLPQPSALNPAVDPVVERVLVRALAKEPAHRFASAGEMVQALRAAPRHPSGAPDAATHWDGTPPSQSTQERPRRRVPLMMMGGALLLMLMAIGAGGLWTLFESGLLGGGATRTPGTEVALVTDEAPVPGTPLPAATATVTGTPTATATTIATATATPTPTATATPSPTLPAWVLAPGQQVNHIAFVSDRTGREAIYAMDIDSEAWEQLTEPGPGERHWWPAWCGADRLVFEAGDLPFEGSRQEVWVRELGQADETWALTGNGRPANTASNGLPRCSPDGQTVAFSSLLQGTGSSAFRLGLLSLANLNAPFRLVGDGYALAGNASWASDGASMVFMHFDDLLNNHQIYRVPLGNAGSATNLTDLYSGNAKYPDWSWQRRQIVMACQEGGGANAVWSLCITPDNSPQVTLLLEDLHRGPERDNDRRVVVHALTPSWSPDGSAIAFASDMDGDWDIYLYEMASGALVNLTASWSGTEMHPSWRK